MVNKNQEENKDLLIRIDERVKVITEETLPEIKADVKKLCDRDRNHESRISVLEGRWGLVMKVGIPVGGGSIVALLKAFGVY